jgi:hypothetical protein
VASYDEAVDRHSTTGSHQNYIACAEFGEACRLCTASQHAAPPRKRRYPARTNGYPARSRSWPHAAIRLGSRELAALVQRCTYAPQIVRYRESFSVVLAGCVGVSSFESIQFLTPLGLMARVATRAIVVCGLWVATREIMWTGLMLLRSVWLPRPPTQLKQTWGRCSKTVPKV